MSELNEILAIDNRPYDPVLAGKRPRVDQSDGRPPRPDRPSTPSFSFSGSSPAAFSMPPQLKDFLNKSIEEYKKLSLARNRANAYLTRLRAQRAEGQTPNSLRMKPPKIKVADPTAQANLDLQMSAHAETYRQACFDSLIQAQSVSAAALDKQFEEYYGLFAERRRQLIHRLADLPLVLVTASTWTQQLRTWDQTIACQFRDAVNTWAISQCLKEGIKATAFKARQAAQEAAMEDAEALPREDSVRHFIRKEIASVLRLQFEQLSARKQSKNGRKSKNGQTSKPKAQQNNRRPKKTSAPADPPREARTSARTSQRTARSSSRPANSSRPRQNSRPPPRRAQGPQQSKDQGNRRPQQQQQRRRPSTPSTAQPSSSRRSRSVRRSGSGQQQRRPRSQSTFRSQSRSVPPTRRTRIPPGGSSGSRY